MVEHQPSKESQEPNEPQAEWNPDSSGACANSPTPSATKSVQPAKNEELAPDIEQFFCIYCGYDLTGNTSGRCPECGEAV